ncbi:helix-turn-helix domain-containing protein [Azospirillum argentinense]
MDITAAQIRAARGLLEWSQARLAEESGVSVSTIKSVEAGRRKPIPANIAALRKALEDGGVEFVDGGVKPRNTGA